MISYTPENEHDNEKQPVEDAFPINMVIFHCHVNFRDSKPVNLFLKYLKDFGSRHSTADSLSMAQEGI